MIAAARTTLIACAALALLPWAAGAALLELRLQELRLQGSARRRVRAGRGRVAPGRAAAGVMDRRGPAYTLDAAGATP